MSDATIVVCLGALALIGALPRIFFRRGRLNSRWWLTASPFALAGCALLASAVGLLDSPLGALLRERLAWPAIVLAAAGVALIRWTLHTHARPVSLWHQEDDRPDELVTRGAYAHVRHPFYASFLLVLGACALALPHALTIVALVCGFVLLDRTAAREEHRLLAAFGDQYARYLRRTGRFVPRRMFAASAVALLLLCGANPVAAQRIPEIDPGDLISVGESSRDREMDAWTGGGLLGLGVGAMLAGGSDAPGDVLMLAAIGGAFGAGIAEHTALRGDGGAATLLGGLLGSLAGAAVGHVAGGSEADGLVLVVSSAGLGGLLGKAASTFVEGL